MELSKAGMEKIIQYKKDYLFEVGYSSIVIWIICGIIVFFENWIKDALIWWISWGLWITIIMSLYWQFFLYYRYELEEYIKELEERLIKNDLEIFRIINE